MADAAFDIPPTARLVAVMGQRDRALDEAASWEAVAMTEREKVTALTAELMRQAALLDELQRDTKPGDEKPSDGGTVDYLPVESDAERA